MSIGCLFICLSIYLLYRTILCMLALHSMWHIYRFHILVGLLCCDLFLNWVGVTRGKRPHTPAKRHIGHLGIEWNMSDTGCRSCSLACRPRFRGGSIRGLSSSRRCYDGSIPRRTWSWVTLTLPKPYSYPWVGQDHHDCYRYRWWLLVTWCWWWLGIFCWWLWFHSVVF